MVYGISKDSTSALNKFQCKYGLTLPMLSDTGGRYRALLGSPDGADEPASRVTYVIDTSGVVRCVIGVPRIGADEHAQAALDCLASV